MSANMTITITTRQLVSVLLILIIAGLGFAWYGLPEYPWVFGPAIGLTLIAAGVMAWVYRDNEGAEGRKALQKQDKKTVKKLFQTLLRELKNRGQYKQKYRMPWYLFISHDLQNDSAVLYQMGFRQSAQADTEGDTAVTVWLKNNAVMLTVNLSGQDSRTLNAIKLLLQHVKGFRPRQVLNGIVISQSVEHLLGKDKSNNKQIAQDSRLLIDNTQSLCGQKLPVYVLFDQMSGLADLCQFFCLHGRNPFGGVFWCT